MFGKLWRLQKIVMASEKREKSCSSLRLYTRQHDDNEFMVCGEGDEEIFGENTFFKLHGTHFNVYLFNNQLD